MQIDNDIAIPDAAKKSRRSSSAKQKGASGEREALVNIVIAMQKVERDLGMFDDNAQSHKVQRNLQQSIAGGHDLVGIPCIAIEVKRNETLAVEAWWLQTVTQANRVNQMPVLLYRQNNKPWKVRTYAKLECPPYDTTQWVVCDITLESFLAFYSQLYANWLLTAKSEKHIS